MRDDGAEAVLIEVLLDELRTVFGTTIRVARELPSHGRARLDIVIWSPEELIGVEAKMTDWRRAIAQARLNRYCVNQSYVAVASSCVSRDLLSDATKFGVGVLAVDVAGITVVVPSPQADPEPSLRQRLIDRLIVCNEVADI